MIAAYASETESATCVETSKEYFDDERSHNF